MNNLKEIVELESRRTVGYTEAKNKESFMLGVNVAFSITKAHYETEIKNLKNKIEKHRSNYKDATGDLKTLASIISRYLDNEC
jgi:hypothetical protein